MPPNPLQYEYFIIASIYKSKYDKFYSVAASITNDRELSNDVVQSAFEIIIKDYDRRKHMPEEEMSRYIMGIVRNKAHEFVREEEKEIRKCRRLIFNESDEILLTLERQCDRETVRKALSMMNSKSAKYLKLYYIEGLSNKEVALLMGVKPKSVAVLRHRAKETLRTIFEKLDQNNM